MPVYEFSCPSCGVFEQMRPVMDAGAPMDCPECGAPARRRFAAPGDRRTPPERNEHDAVRGVRAELHPALGRRRHRGEP